jgi:serine phosphatase RsbU (regulator of sigma subunit)
MFGRDSLIAVLRSGLAHAPEEMIATAIDCLESSVAEPPGDDLTLLVIEWPIKRM